MTRNKGSLPNLIIIGAQKCATTSLHYYLWLHPQIAMSKEKELNFFVREMNWPKGLEWYMSNFLRPAKIRGESSTCYTLYPFFAGVAERMHSVVPDAKLIYILRDPIDRLISHYLHKYSMGREERSIDDALSRFEDNPYVLRSRYFMQLEQYLKFYKKADILIVKMEDLKENHLRTLKHIFTFLEVDETFYSPKFLEKRHESSRKGKKNRIGLMLRSLSETRAAKIFPTDFRMKVGSILYRPFSTEIKRPELSAGKREELIAFLKDDINRLREFAGRKFDGWSV